MTTKTTVGDFDECGVCNGIGIPEGACDCEGNVLSECGVCGGTNDECGCTDPEACNYAPDASVEDGSCDYCSCGAEDVQYQLVVDSVPAVFVGGTVYRLSIQTQDPTDRLSAVFGDLNHPMSIHAPSGVFNSPLNAPWSASGLNPALLAAFPEIAEDSYATIGLDGPSSTSTLDGAEDPSLVQDVEQPVTPFFTMDEAVPLKSTPTRGRRGMP